MTASRTKAVTRRRRGAKGRGAAPPPAPTLLSRGMPVSGDAEYIGSAIDRLAVWLHAISDIAVRALHHERDTARELDELRGRVAAELADVRHEMALQLDAAAAGDKALRERVEILEREAGEAAADRMASQEGKP